MSTLGNLVLTGTSLAPVLLVYGLLALFERVWLWGAVLIVVGLAVTLCCLALLLYFKKHLERLPLAFCSAEVADRETIGVLVLYLLPLLRTSFTDLDKLILIPAAVIFLALALTGYNYHFNPLLALLRYKFYKVGTPEGISYLLITRKDLRNTTEALVVGKLTGYTVIDLGS